MTTVVHRIPIRVSVAGIAVCLLLFGAFISLTSGLSGMVRGLDGSLLFLLTVTGLIAGWLLARSNLHDLPGVLILILSGALVLVIRLSGLLIHGLIALWSLIGSHPGTLLWLYAFHPDFKLLSQSLMAIGTSLGVMYARLGSWIIGLRIGEPWYDPLITALIWGFAVWCSAAWAGWAMRRRKPVLQVLLPALILLAGSFGLVRFTPTALLIFFSCLFLLNILAGQIYREQRWESSSTDYTLEIRNDLALSAIPLSVLILAAAALIPLFSLHQFTDFFRDLTSSPASQQPRLAESFGLNPPPEEKTGADTLRSPGLPREHLVGSGPELEKKVVMTISLSDPQPKEAGYYWRGLTYDWYTGHGWATHPTGKNDFRPGTMLFTYDPKLFRPLREEIHGVEPLGQILYHTGLLLTSNRPFRSERRAQLDLFAATVKFNTYQADSAVPIYDRTLLRSAGIEYPVQIRELYLQLPKELPQRVYTLARDITASQSNPYDQAQSIQEYLRKFPYTLDLPAPPPERDIADYFLFDLKKGYCDYFATSMVVLSRAAGIPARMVMGYASGHYDPALNATVVTEADAHSWPELYFPGYGWVEFEPTSSRNLNIESSRPGQAPVIPTPETPGTSRNSSLGKGVSTQTAFLFLLGILAFLLTARAWSRWRERTQPAIRSLDRAYLALRRSAAWLHSPVQRGDTPLEVAKHMATSLDSIQPTGWQGRNANLAQQEIIDFAGIYSRAAYGSKPISYQDRESGMEVWRRLRVRLWLIRFGIHPNPQKGRKP